MTALKLFGVLFFCGLLSPSQEVLTGLSCAVSPGALQKVLSDAMLKNGLLQQHLQGLVLPNIMGDGGLLSSPTSITGLHLVKVQIPDLSVLLSGIGVRLTIAAQLELNGNCLIGLLPELIDILVDVSITVNIKCTNFESGAVQVVAEDCLCILGAVKVKLLSGLLSLSVNAIVLNQLTATLPGLLCPVIDLVTRLVGIQLLGTVSGAFLVEQEGVVKQVGGSVIPHDSSPSALPPLLDKLLVLGVRQSFLNAVLPLLVRTAPQTFACTPEVVSAAAPVFRAGEAAGDTLGLPCSACHGNSLLNLKLTLSGNPLIILEENKATVELSVLIEVTIKLADGTNLIVLLAKADLGLHTLVSLAREALLSANQELAPLPGHGRGKGKPGLDISLSLESSEVGIRNVSLWFQRGCAQWQSG
ncbi:PREDICTED: BPI fold-containing family B member 4-like [Buceros rhinoceros silvestris]|uniref:BPI fold-containing family B member 4-like n=1 Tax=Buceros rhinoceros silvestris TaxID=175836 RepID=UPI0005284080|nr:PREDICTED: BPI fold-containing family B member 4-like [Buceros rhinoceros silvestris]